MPPAPSDTHVLGFPWQTTGVDLVVKTVPVPDTGDSVVSGALNPRELSAPAAGPWVSVVTIVLPMRDVVQGLGLDSSERLGTELWSEKPPREGEGEEGELKDGPS